MFLWPTVYVGYYSFPLLFHIFKFIQQVDSAVPGDVVKICGIVKVSDAEENKSRSKEKSMFLLYILANSVENCKDSQKASDNGSEIVTEFTLKVNYRNVCILE